MPHVLRQDPERPIPPVVRDVLISHGWLEYDEDIPADQQPDVSLFWKTNRFFPSEIQAMAYPHQRVNHYPRSSEITKKDLLYRHMRRMKGVHGSAYDFVPTTFALPTEYVKFCQYYVDQKDKALDAGARAPVYICKPSELSRGRKIFCFDDIGELTYDCSSVVQQYVDNPLLVHNHKADFRIYVLVTCFKPLRAYIFKEGLTRMSVEEYTMDDVKNIFAHLTNYSVNKQSEQWESIKNGIGSGCKWDFATTREYFTGRGIDFDVLFSRIENLVCLTLLSISNNVQPVAQCFELYGFDVLFDADFKPWLMEVNFSPALAVESDVDARVKEPLIWDLVNTLGIPEPLSAVATSEVSPTSPDDEVKPRRGSSPPLPPPQSKTATSATTSSKSGTGGSGKPLVPKSTNKAVGGSSASSMKPPLHAQKASSATVRKRDGRDAAVPGRTGTGSNSASSTGVGGVRSSSSTRGPSFRTQPLAARQTRSSSVSGRGAVSTTGGSASSSTSTRGGVPSKFTDSAQGLFKVCFPFNDTVEGLNKQMADSSAPEKHVRSIITEIKKREAKNIAAIKSWNAVS